MRKTLLITSALGLVSALPTLAMANAAGSTAAACGSGFFAQFDAKIMNAKLEIKNEKDTKIPDLKSEADDVIEKELKADFVSSLKSGGVEVEILFRGKFSTKADEKKAATNAVEEYTLNDVKTDDDFLKKLDGDNAIPAETKAAGSNGREELLRYARIMRDLGSEANLNGTTPLKDVIINAADATEKILDSRVTQSDKRSSVDDLVTFIADPNLITSITNADGTLVPGSFFRARKVYIVDREEDNALNSTDVNNALRREFAKPEFARAIGELKSPAILSLVAAEKKARIQFNTEVKREKDAGYDLTDRRVHHHALAGGVGATAGWWQNMGSFAVSISTSGDYHWGTFRTVDDAAGKTLDAKDKRKLGFGFQGDLGVHYVVSPNTTLGVLVGFRGQQLNIGRTDQTKTITNSKDSKGDYASKWMWNPVVSAQARTFFTDTVYGALTVGYIIPIERDYKLEHTNIPNKDAKVRLQGLTGAFSVGMMF